MSRCGCAPWFQKPNSTFNMCDVAGNQCIRKEFESYSEDLVDRIECDCRYYHNIINLWPFPYLFWILIGLIVVESTFSQEKPEGLMRTNQLLILTNISHLKITQECWKITFLIRNLHLLMKSHQIWIKFCIERMLQSWQFKGWAMI